MKLKIIMVSKYFTGFHDYTGGMEFHLKDLADHLSKQGHDVTIIVSRFDFNNDHYYPYKILQTNSRVTYNPISRIIFFFESSSLFKKIIKENGVDVVHGQSNFAFGILRLLRKSNTPLITTLHGTTLNEFRTILRSRPLLAIPWFILLIFYFIVEAILLKKSNKIIVVSEQLKADVIKQYKLNPKKVDIIVNGVDTDIFKRTKPHDDNISQVLYVGRITKEKGIDVAINSVASLRKQGLDIKLTIAGNGPFESAAKGLVKALSIGKEVKFLGNIERSKLPAIYNKHKIFIFPSISNEGLPYVVLEAMSTSMCVITSDIPGLKTIAKHKRTALIYPMGDTDAFTQKLKLSLTDRELATKLGNNARQLIVQDYSRRKMMKSVIEIYRDAVKE